MQECLTFWQAAISGAFFCIPISHSSCLLTLACAYTHDLMPFAFLLCFWVEYFRGDLTAMLYHPFSVFKLSRMQQKGSWSIGIPP